MDSRTTGRAKLAASLDRIPAAEAKAAPAAKPKTGVETVHVKGWKSSADAAPQDMVRMIDHGSNRVLFFGTAAEHKALRRAFAKE